MYPTPVVSPPQVRKDLYGLAKQPQDFDPLTLNSQHFRTMARIPNKTVLGRLLGRRVQAKWVLDFPALFRAIPPSRGDTRMTTGPQRKKWDGGEKMGVGETAGLAVASMVSLAGLVGLLVKAPTMHKLDTGVGVAVALALLSVVSNLCNNVSGTRDKARAAWVVLAPALFAILSARPGARVAAMVGMWAARRRGVAPATRAAVVRGVVASAASAIRS